MALKAGYVGVKKNDATKLSQLPGITEIGTGLELDDGELSATGATKTIEGNPEGSATTDLTKLQIGTTIYGVSNVKANPSGTATSDLTKLTVDNTIYSIPGNDNSKCYQTDDATESAIVDADYIPFLDSSAASGAGAPRKSTWSNFISKIKAKLTEFVTWTDFAKVGAINFLNAPDNTVSGAGDFIGDNTAINLPAGSYKFSFEVTGTVTEGKQFVLTDRTTGNVNLVTGNLSSGTNIVSFTTDTAVTKIKAYENDSAELTFSNFMIAESDYEGEYVPFSLSNAELTEKLLGIINAASNASDFAAFKTAISNL